MMNIDRRTVLLGTGMACAVLVATATGAAPGSTTTPAAAGGNQQAAEYGNLQVLPADISRDALGEIMVGNLLGLGLPRRDGEGCLYCHVGDFDEPRDTWDYASDEKTAKRKARDMMAMVASINDDFLSGLEARVGPGFEVTCATCHAGRTDPRPLPEILVETYREDGIEEALARYERLRSRYFAAGAYDFRPRVLAGLANGIAGAGDFGAALALAETNARHNPNDGNANATVLLIELQQRFAAAGVDAALGLFDELSAGEQSQWINFSLLDSFGWTINRRGEVDASVAVFRHNLESFPDEYIPHESLADALIIEDIDRAAGIALYEAWLARHPDHETARRRLAGLR